MILERAVDEYRINKGMYKPDKWISIPIGRYWIPVLPAWGFKDWLFLHDAHRLFNDFSTGMAGEAELFAWEVGSGRFGRRWWIWFGLIDLIFFSIFMRKAVLKGLKLGRQQHNLYKFDVEELKQKNLEEIKHYVQFGIFPKNN